MHDTVATGATGMGITDSEVTQPRHNVSVLPPASSDIHKWWLSDGMWLPCFLFLSVVLSVTVSGAPY